MYGIQEGLARELGEIRAAGLYKNERVIASPQGARIRVAQGEVTNFCANNYLGLSSHPEIIRAAKEGLEKYGYGLSSVRFICGTQEIHKELEKKIASFLGTDDAILYSSCFDANGGLFETLCGEEDAIISDALNHASIIDGVRLSKAKRLRYAHSDMAELEKCLGEAAGCRRKLVATDGVFSMDGDVARLADIAQIADRHGAILMVDDSHATGFVGANGRGTPEHCGVEGRIDILTSTLGKALGGASGGFTTGRREIVELLRQRSRPYLFSNTLPPPIVCAAMKAIDLIAASHDLRERLAASTARFRSEMTSRGFRIQPGSHPICPVMLGDAKLASGMADRLLREGIYVIGFSYPVVPKGQARIRVQISAAHTREDVDRAVAAFHKVGKELGVIR
ncbi:MAG: glycine C-acetyltransferase [Planctomycetes bacterium]|nr:glycine C-acetyltransferase [Planctomycetota bacterium]